MKGCGTTIKLQCFVSTYLFTKFSICLATPVGAIQMAPLVLLWVRLVEVALQ